MFSVKNTCESTKASESWGDFSAVLYEKGCFLIRVQQQKFSYAMIQQSRLVGNIYFNLFSLMLDFIICLYWGLRFLKA